MCTEKERVIKKALTIKNTGFYNKNHIRQLFNFLALYLDNDEMPIEICSGYKNSKYFYDVKTDKQRSLQILQGSDLNELTDNKLQDLELAKSLENCKAVQVEIVPLR